MAYFEEVTMSDIKDVIRTLAKGNQDYYLSSSKDIKTFANAYFRLKKYDYFDVLDTLNYPNAMTRWFKRFYQIDLTLEPDDTPELNHQFINFICKRVTEAHDLFSELTIGCMQDFVDEHIQYVFDTSDCDPYVQPPKFEEYINGNL